MNKNQFARHPLTHVALERLRQLSLGEEVSYAELADLLGVDPQGDGRQFVYNARQILRRAQIIIYPTETRSLRRWTNQEIADQEEVLRNRRIRRQARLGQQGLEAVNLNVLTPEEQRKVTAGLGHLGAIQQWTDLKFTEARNQGLIANNDPSPSTPTPPPRS